MAYGGWHGAAWRDVWNNGVYSIDVLWDFCQDIEANKTKIAMKAIRVKKNNSAYSFYNAYGKVGLGDFSGNKFESTVSMDLRNASSQTFDLTDRHAECTHNADGSWPNGTYCGWWEFKAGVNAYNSPEVGWTYFNVDGSIPKIPRATVPTLNANSVNMGSAVTINLPKATSSFTHDIFYKYSSDSSYTTLASGVTGTSQSWTPPVSLASKIPNASSGVWNILVRTKSGSTIIGDKIINVTLNVPSNIVPSISSVGVAEATAGIAAQFAAYIQGRSTFKVTVAAAGNQRSTIKSYSVKADGKTYSGNSNVFTTQVINGSGNISVVATVTDSRGRTASKTVSVAVTAYSSPSIPTFKAVRCTSAGVEDEDGTAVKISFNFSIAAMGNKNTRSFKIQQLNGNTWTDIYTITDSYSTNSSIIKTGPFSVDSKFSFRAVAADFFTSATVYSDVSPSFALINFGAGGKSLAFGGVSSNDGSFESYMATKVYNKFQVPIAKDLTDNGVPFAGAGPELTDLTQLSNYRSFIGALTLNGVWNNVLSIRHKNGYSDGSNYGMYIRSALTSSGSLFYRQQYGGNWASERMIVDSWNYPEATKRYHYRFYCPSGGGARWVHIGDFPSNPGGTTHAITIYTGNGFNGRSDQNSEIEIRIKPAAENYGTTFWVNGYYHNSIQVKVYTQSTSTPCQLWVYFPWEWYSGSVEVYTEGSFNFSGANQTGTPAQPANTANAPVANITPDMRGYPIGSVFECNAASISNPANVMGGTWQEIRAVFANINNSNQVIDVAGGATANGTNIDLHVFNGSNAQKFLIHGSPAGQNTARYDLRMWIRTQ